MIGLRHFVGVVADEVVFQRRPDGDVRTGGNRNIVEHQPGNAPAVNVALIGVGIDRLRHFKVIAAVPVEAFKIRLCLGAEMLAVQLRQVGNGKAGAVVHHGDLEVLHAGKRLPVAVPGVPERVVILIVIHIEHPARFARTAVGDDSGFVERQRIVAVALLRFVPGHAECRMAKLHGIFAVPQPVLHVFGNLKAALDVLRTEVAVRHRGLQRVFAVTVEVEVHVIALFAAVAVILIPAVCDVDPAVYIMLLVIRQLPQRDIAVEQIPAERRGRAVTALPQAVLQNGLHVLVVQGLLLRLLCGLVSFIGLFAAVAQRQRAAHRVGHRGLTDVPEGAASGERAKPGSFVIFAFCALVAAQHHFQTGFHVPAVFIPIKDEQHGFHRRGRKQRDRQKKGDCF